MGGQWQHRRQAAAHKRARAAYLAQVVWGTTLCPRCGQILTPPVQLDHSDTGDGYLGLSHKSCNARAGGLKGALLQGKKPRSRACCICGANFTASRGTDGSQAATCGQRSCLNALRAARKAGEPDPQPPAQTGRAWLPVRAGGVQPAFTAPAPVLTIAVVDVDVVAAAEHPVEQVPGIRHHINRLYGIVGITRRRTH